MIAAGNLNRRLTLYAPVTLRSDTGMEKTGWRTSGTVWAAQENLSLREIERTSGLTSVAEAKFVIRYRQGITERFEVVCEKRRYSVIAVEEIGLHEGLRLLVKAL
jgi:SPP1 family predicted phage head-tail adaptor